jgi:hypothetical protein
MNQKVMGEPKVSCATCVTTVRVLIVAGTGAFSAGANVGVKGITDREERARVL